NLREGSEATRRSRLSPSRRGRLMDETQAGRSRISNPIDFGRDGRQVGYLQVPDDPATGEPGARVPIVSIANGAGPTVLVSGGNHGDEYEGQIAALRLIRDIEPAQVSGRIIIVPIISTAASKAHSRFWPSGANFNRSF